MSLTERVVTQTGQTLVYRNGSPDGKDMQGCPDSGSLVDVTASFGPDLLQELGSTDGGTTDGCLPLGVDGVVGWV
jgi:hypothetical protein